MLLFSIILTSLCLHFSSRCSGRSERFSRMHPLSEDERCDPWLRREGKSHSWCKTWLFGSLHQFWDVLPQWWQVCGEIQRLFLWLLHHCLWRAFLFKRSVCICKLESHTFKSFLWSLYTSARDMTMNNLFFKPATDRNLRGQLLYLSFSDECSNSITDMSRPLL